MLLNNCSSFLYYKAIDMRKGINGLRIMVSDELSSNPGDGSIYIFYNKNLDKIKLLYWDQNGYCMLYKVLEKSRFKIPKMVISRNISFKELRWLLDGLPLDYKGSDFKENYDTYF
jgi:transposase